MIEGTAVAQNGAFEAIYASSFYYNDKGVAVWPSQVINYTNKTQFLFRIEKASSTSTTPPSMMPSKRKTCACPSGT
jgi:hypothetical protein